MSDEKRCPECGVSHGHKMSCGQAPERVRRIHARAKAGTLEILYAGRATEIAYLREAIAKEPDPDDRRRMQERLHYVEGKTDEELHLELTGKPKPVEH